MTDEELDTARALEAYRLWSIQGYVDSGPSGYEIAARLAREGWMPPVAVDPDLAMLTKWLLDRPCVENERGGYGFNGFYPDGTVTPVVIAALKLGRALAAAEAKPGLVWVKHDGSNHCPIDPDSYVWIRRQAPLSVQTAILMAGAVGWHNVTHYAIISQPEDK